MLKTQPRPANITSSQLDRSVVEKTKYSSNPTKQYLDVALARGSADLDEKRGKVNKKGKYTVKGLDSLDNIQAPKRPAPGSKPLGKGAVAGGAEKRVDGQYYKQDGFGGKPGKATKQPELKKDTGATFKERIKFENQKNQRLYQDLDDMLAGKHSVSYPVSKKQKQDNTNAGAKQSPFKKEKVNLVTKETLFPGLSKEVKDKPPGSYRGQPVPPLQKKGSIAAESEAWYSRELLARQRIQHLETIDKLQPADYSKRTKIFDTKPVEQRQTIGVPLHSVNTTGRRHIVADIPIYVPQYGVGHPGNQQAVTNIQAVPVDRVYQNTLPNASGVQTSTNRGNLPHAPEGITLPQQKANPGEGADNPYLYNDPVTARQQLERAEKERAQLEKESLQYFDTDPGTDFAVSSTRNNPISVREDGHRDRTLMSDPGPGRNVPPTSDGLEDLKYSPEGFLAEKRRQHRLEKEAKMHQRYNPNYSLESIKDEWGPESYRDTGRYSNRNSKDRYFKPDVPESRKPFEQENSWFRDPGTTGRSTEAGTYRQQETGYSGRTYNITSQRNAARVQSPGVSVREHGQETNRSYQILTELRDRDRYSDRNAYRGDEERERNRRTYDKEMERGYASHLAKEREMNLPERRPFDEHSPDFRSRYKESSGYPTGSEYPKDLDYKTNQDRYARPRQPEDDYEKGGYSLRSKEERGEHAHRRDSAGKMPKNEEKKVQYVLRTKSGLSKSQLSQRSGSLPENVPPQSTEMTKRDDRSSEQNGRQPEKAKDENRINPQSFARQDPIGSEKTKATVQEPPGPMSAAKADERKDSSSRDHDDLNKYFDDAYDPKDPANKIPFYSDNVSRYSKQKHDLRGGEVMPMTPVQETSMRQSEEDSASNRDGPRTADQGQDKEKVDPYARSDRNGGKYIQNNSSLLDNSTPKLELLKTKYPSSTVNKHFIEEDRRSPWRRSPWKKEAEEPKPEGPDFSKVDRNSGKSRGAKDQSSVEYIKERIREKTLEKMRQKGRELSGGDLFRPTKERTMDSQGPDVDISQERDTNRNQKGPREDPEEELPDNLDDIETEMDEKELYVCYLMTDNGEAIGPLRLDIDDVQLGLPKPLEKPDIATEESEGK